MTLFDDCNSLTPPNGVWAVADDSGQNLGSVISIDNVVFVEGGASIKVMGSISTWNCWLYVRPTPDVAGSRWDLHLEPKMRLRLRFSGQPTTKIRFGIVSAAPDGWGWIAHEFTPLSLTVDQWMEYTIDMRMDANGVVVPDSELSMVRQVYFWIETVYGAPWTLWIDWIETLLGGIGPIGGTITPTSVIADQGTIVQMIAQISGGIPPYNVNWLVNGVVAHTEQTSGSSSFPFNASTVGTFTVTVQVTDQQPVTTVIGASTILVRAPPPPPSPCRPLHVSGNKIVNDLGKTVYLRGVNYHSFADGPNGNWIDINGVVHWDTWDTTLIQTFINGIWSWGANCVRIHSSVELWVKNIGNYIDHIKTFLAICHNLGIYVDIDFYSIRYYGQPGTRQTPIPYPPYLNADEQAAVGWTSSQDFANFWGSVATQLKDYPNVIFDIWNEPNGTAAEMDEYLGVVQQCINAIRATGATQLITAMAGYGGVAYYDAPLPGGSLVSASGLDWMLRNPLSDSLGNLLPQIHLYREYGGIGWTEPSGNWSARKDFYKHEDILRALTDESVIAVAKRYPVFVGEFGANQVNPTPAPDGADPMTAELVALTNLLDIMNTNGMHYAAWLFWYDMTFGLLQANAPNYQPTQAGQLLIQGIQLPSAPTPSQASWTPLAIGTGLILILP